MSVGSLFSGIGGLELGLEMCGAGPVLWQCDSDPYARQVLEAHWPGVRRYEDVRSIDARAERPDIICGGFPCQPVSEAGARKAQRDPRWLWPFFASVLHAVRPPLVFIENVPGLRSAGLRDVLADLALLGFDAEWGDFSAEEVGAPHRRRRLFIVAHAHGSRQRTREYAVRARESNSPRSGRNLAHANGDGQPQPGGCVGEERRRPSDRRHEAPVADSARQGCAGAEPGNGGPRRAPVVPGGQDLAHAESIGPQQRGGLEPGEDCEAGRDVHQWVVEPDVGRVADGVPARTHRLRLLGNACVPAQAALAWRTLIARAAA